MAGSICVNGLVLVILVEKFPLTRGQHDLLMVPYIWYNKIKTSKKYKLNICVMGVVPVDTRTPLLIFYFKIPVLVWKTWDSGLLRPKGYKVGICTQIFLYLDQNCLFVPIIIGSSSCLVSDKLFWLPIKTSRQNLFTSIGYVLLVFPFILSKLHQVHGEITETRPLKANYVNITCTDNISCWIIARCP